MVIFRVTGKLLLIMSVLALGLDGARILANPLQPASIASLTTHLGLLAPDALSYVQTATPDTQSQFFWRWVVAPLMSLPFAVVLALSGMAIFMIGYRRPPIEAIPDRML